MNEQASAAMKEYEKIKGQIKQLKESLDMLKPVLIDNIPLGTEIETDLGKFNVQSRSSWEYSDRVKEAKKEIEELESQEKADGTATEKPGVPFVTYRVNK